MDHLNFQKDVAWELMRQLDPTTTLPRKYTNVDICPLDMKAMKSTYFTVDLFPAVDNIFFKAL